MVLYCLWNPVGHTMECCQSLFLPHDSRDILSESVDPPLPTLGFLECVYSHGCWITYIYLLEKFIIIFICKISHENTLQSDILCLFKHSSINHKNLFSQTSCTLGEGLLLCPVSLFRSFFFRSIPDLTSNGNWSVKQPRRAERGRSEGQQEWLEVW